MRTKANTNQTKQYALPTRDPSGNNVQEPSIKLNGCQIKVKSTTTYHNKIKHWVIKISTNHMPCMRYF